MCACEDAEDDEDEEGEEESMAGGRTTTMGGRRAIRPGYRVFMSESLVGKRISMFWINCQLELVANGVHSPPTSHRSSSRSTSLSGRHSPISPSKLCLADYVSMSFIRSF